MKNNNLPVGSSTYGNTIFKDTDNRMWTGKPGSYTTIKDTVNITDFGAIGDGVTDNAVAFTEALDVAIALNCFLYVPNGDFVIVHGSGAIDATGCEGVIGEGTLIFDTIDEDTPILSWTGEVTLVSVPVPVTAGSRTATIGTGHDIAIGDTVFMVSNTTKPNLADINKLGQRLTVSEYDAVTGGIVFYEEFYYTVSDGYFYHNNYQPRVEVSGVTVKALVNTPRKGIEVSWCDFTSNELTISGFSRFCLNISSSRGFVCNFKTRDFYYTGSGTSYGLQISGLSDTETYGVDIAGGRHAIAHGDVGLWTGDMVGGVSGALFFGAVSKIFGGNLKGDKFAALDSHGCTRSIYVQGSEIIGTAGIGGDINIMKDCVIRATVQLHNIQVGRDSVDNSIPRGYYEFDGCTIFTSNTGLINLITSVETLILSNITINSGNDTAAIRPMIGYNAAAVTASNLIFEDINILGDNNRDRYTFKINPGLRVNRVQSYKADFAFELSENITQTLFLSDIVIGGSYGNGIVFRDLSVSGVLTVKCDRFNVTASSADNIYFVDVDNADLSNVTTQTGSRGIRVSGMAGQFRLTKASISGQTNQSIWFQGLASAKITLINVDTDTAPSLGSVVDVYQNNVNIGSSGWKTSSLTLLSLNTAPASATAAGTTGEIRVTATHIYVCTATNTWVRTALTTW